MARKHKFEVRPRKEFMMPGKIVTAENPEKAMMDPMGGNKIGSIVIDIAEGRWYLIPQKGYWTRLAVKINEEAVSPFDPDPQRRMAVAKACEKECQIYDKNQTNKYSNFDDQLEQYKKAYAKSKKEAVKEREAFKKEAVTKVAKCLVECTLSESALYNGEKRKSNNSIMTAERLLKEATKLAYASCTPGIEQPNSAMLAVTDARQQLDKTIKINKARGKIAIPENQMEMFA